MKVTIIGGGSYLWTFGVTRQFVDCEGFTGLTLTLMDIDADAVELVRSAGGVYNESHGSPIKIESTIDLDGALEGSDFVLICISTGDLEAMACDIEIPTKYGLCHTVGDTVGPGGWSRLVRNVPVFYKIAQRMSHLCPDAWLINVTNPLTPLTRVPQKYFGIKSIGLCTGGIELAEALIAHAGLSNDRVDYILTGINHGSWLTELWADGTDVLARIKEMGFYRSDDKLPETIYMDDQKIGVYGSRAIFAVWREIGTMPSINDRHAVENWPWFLFSEAGELTHGIEITTIAKRREKKLARRDKLREIVESRDTSLAGGLGHGDDPIVPLIESLLGRLSLTIPVNYMNIGQIPDAPAGAVVETRGRIDGAGVHPMASPMPPAVKALVMPHIYRQEALVDIALEGSFDDLVAMVTTDPMCSRLPIGQTRRMMAQMMDATSQWIQNPRLLEF